MGGVKRSAPLVENAEESSGWLVVPVELRNASELWSSVEMALQPQQCLWRPCHLVAQAHLQHFPTAFLHPNGMLLPCPVLRDRRKPGQPMQWPIPLSWWQQQRTGCASCRCAHGRHRGHTGASDCTVK